MTIAVTDLGHTGNTAGATLTASLTVPAGAFIFVFVQENSSSFGSGTLSDATNGAYTKIGSLANNNVGANGGNSLWYFPSSAALSSITLTYTKGSSGVATVMSYFYGTGIAAIDAAVTKSAFGTGTAVSVASGPPSFAGELFLGAASSSVNGGTYTQDTANGWAAPFDSDNSQASVSIGGGDQINPTLNAKTFAPTVSNGAWAAWIVGFKGSAAPGVLTLGAGIGNQVDRRPVSPPSGSLSITPNDTNVLVTPCRKLILPNEAAGNTVKVRMIGDGSTPTFTLAAGLTILDIQCDMVFATGTTLQNNPIGLFHVNE